MTAPSPFHVAREIGNNLSGAFNKVRDENAIESILSQSMQSGDPAVLQNNIGKILSQVSPERQGAAIQFLEHSYNNVMQKQKQAREQEAAKKYGVDSSLPPALQAAVYKENQKNQRLGAANDIFGGGNPVVQPQQTPTPSQPNMPIEQPTAANLASRKQQLLALTGHPDREVAERAKAELKSLEAAEKNDRADLREIRKETLPLKEKIIERADLSRESIRNKNHLLEIIDRGNLDDPSFAIFATSLPMNLGKRMLSPDTVEYKGGLVDEFADLKNIFKGATRVKEVEIYEDKLADIYLNDEQKKAILKSRINAAKVDILREEAAAEVENKYPNVSALQFNKRVDELVQPKINALFNTVWGDQKAVIDQAEARKKTPLSLDDPDDVEIIDQILKEAGGNYLQAEKLAKKKGYTF